MTRRASRKRTARTTKSDEGPSGLRGLTTHELMLEVRRREGLAKRLLVRRQALVRQVEAIDAQLATMKDVTGSKPTTRTRNSLTLVAALSKILTGKQMGIPQIIEALPVVGYRSDSPNLRTMVNVALLKKDTFTRVSRGIYTAK